MELAHINFCTTNKSKSQKLAVPAKALNEERVVNEYFIEADRERGGKVAKQNNNKLGIRRTPIRRDGCSENRLRSEHKPKKPSTRSDI